MSGRINPREYDLGELRDAAREASRRGIEPARSADHSEFGAEPRTASDPDPDSGFDSVVGSESAGPSEATPVGGDGTVSAAEDPEAYLRSRHRRARQSPDESRRAEPDARGGPRHAGTGAPGRDESASLQARVDDPGTGVDFEFLSQGSDGEVSRPYLEELPGSYGAQLEIFEWLDRLIARGGREGAISALEYYESVEWLSAESRADLEEFVAGLGTEDVAAGSLGMSDHRESLSYIARLAGRRRH